MTIRRRGPTESKFKYQLQRLSAWTALRSIGNSTTAKLTIIIPFVGYLIIFNENLSKYMQLSSELFGHHVGDPATVPWRLLAVYFGLSLIAIASLLFATFCPQEIKKYGYTEVYIAATEPFISDFGRVAIEQALIHGDLVSKSTYKDLIGTQNQRPTPQGIDKFRLRDKLFWRMIMHLYYEELDRRHLAVRLIVTFAYVMGIMALSLPGINVFVHVSIVLVRSI